MSSTSAAKIDSKLRWWQVPLIPFAFAGAVVGLLAFLGILAVMAPFMMLSAKRTKLRVERKLRAEGRLINWNDALLEHGADNKELLIEIGPKKIGDIWLVELSPAAKIPFESYPTYSEFEADAKIVWENQEEDEDDIKQILPDMLLAKRIDGAPQTISACDKELKDSIRVITVFNEESPSALLYELTPKKKNA